MAEWRLFPDGTTAHVSTPEFHQHRERAPHLEQPGHRPRLMHAAQLVVNACQALAPDSAPWHRPGSLFPVAVSDLGCGDGGLLSLLQRWVREAWGYDFAPANVAGWAERGVAASAVDVFGVGRDQVRFGDVAVTTEVLEHLQDPHDAVRWIGKHARYLVASSPWDETLAVHDECHAWAWDMPGYRALIEQGGFDVLQHDQVGRFQLVLAQAQS